MSQETPRFHRHAYELFGLTERENLYSQISDQRFQSFITDEAVAIHQVKVDSNAFGEFLFVTLSRQTQDRRAVFTFYGLGFHDQREEWITDRWNWYEVNLSLHSRSQPTLTKDEGIALIRERREEVLSQITPHVPSRHAMLFSLLADLTDEDGALTELEDAGIDPDDLLE